MVFANSQNNMGTGKKAHLQEFGIINFPKSKVDPSFFSQGTPPPRPSLRREPERRPCRSPHHIRHAVTLHLPAMQSSHQLMQVT
jgi:hypothetical protein